MDSELGLKAVLRALALSATDQVKLYPARGSESDCANCRFSTLYSEWVEHFEGEAYRARLDPVRREALAKVDAVSTSANDAPCYEPQYLTQGAAFQELRSVATEALEVFGWTKGAPDLKYLWGHPQCAAILQESLERERAARLQRRRPGGTEEEFGDLPGFDPRTLTVARFRQLLSQVPWFAHLGQPHPRDPYVERIKSWSDWSGPESRAGAAIGSEQSAWQDELFGAEPAARAQTERLWEEVSCEAFQAIARRFPEDLEGDPWDGPSSAAGQACWVAATIAASLDLARPIPRNALRQWAWFARGHWPCLYSEDDDLRFDGDRVALESLERAWLVVY